jgi:hypothetical protein
MVSNKGFLFLSVNSLNANSTSFVPIHKKAAAGKKGWRRLIYVLILVFFPEYGNASLPAAPGPAPFYK